MIANSKVLADTGISMTVSTTGTYTGAAQAKGTATDLQLTVIAGPVGGVALAGTFIPQVQGSNVTSPVATNWTAVTPDKGTLANFTAAGSDTVHLANLQYAYYRIYVSQAAASTAMAESVFNFQNLADSFDDTVQ